METRKLGERGFRPAPAMSNKSLGRLGDALREQLSIPVDRSAARVTVLKRVSGAIPASPDADHALCGRRFPHDIKVILGCRPGSGGPVRRGDTGCRVPGRHRIANVGNLNVGCFPNPWSPNAVQSCGTGRLGHRVM